MNTHDIDLPDLPEHFDIFTDRTHSEIRAYALAAIKADRKRRGEPVAGYTMVPVEPTPQMIAAFRSGFQNELHKNDRRRTMSAEEAGLRAMLKATPQPAEPVKAPSDEVDLEEVRRYLDDWGCLDHPGVRALLARYGRATDEATKQQRKIE